ncbi:MAG: hypothetical protein JWN77_1426 [Frankiales bacterium]|jgi:diguanylate cyclase (GGDEF)-like protein/PAS domain S-box-containing protein|nr:hypothetical protein [Frankiales bacterium]
MDEPPVRGDLLNTTALSDALAAAALASMGQAAVLTDLDGVVLLWNAAAEQLYGYRADEAVGRVLRDLVIPSDGHASAREEAARLVGGKVYSGAWTVHDKARRVFPVHVTSSAVRDDSGELVGLLGVSSDLSRVRAVEAELGASERRFRARFEQAALPQAIFGLDLRCVAVNDALCQLLGRPREDLLARTTEHLHHPSDERHGQLRGVELLSGGRDTDQWERVFQLPDGTALPVFVNATLVRAADGSPESIACFVQDLTQLRAAEERLQAVTDRHEALMAHASDWLVVVDVAGELLYASAAVPAALGYDVADVVGRSGWSFAHPDDVPAVAAAMERVVAEPGRREAVQLRIRHADGRWVWYEEVLTNRLGEPAIGGIVCLGRDIAARVESEQALKASEEWFRNIAATAQEGIWAIDAAGGTLFANDELLRILGVERDVLDDTTPSLLLAPDDPDTLRHAVLTGASGSGPDKHELGYRHPDGTDRRLHVAVSVLQHAGGSGWLAMVSDVTEVRRIEAELRHRALYDELTGLPNRALLLDRLDQALARGAEDSAPVAVLLLDLDDFKLVNDTWGHAAGDQLLQTVADRLAAAVRPSDTVARFGGDEFVVVCEGLDEAEVLALAERLIAAVGERGEVDGHATYVGVSVGIAMSPPECPDHLVRFADAAMYDAKARGRNRAQLFGQELAEAAADRLVLGNDLREALGAGTLRLQYQPIVDLTSGVVVGVEGLARWDHAGRGPVAPSRFVRVAELTGQAPALDAWALDRACADVAQLRAGLGADVTIGVNITAANLGERRLEEQVVAAVTRRNVAPEALVLEVTETTLMAHPEVAKASLERLRAHGVSIAIDDFGTGYSSLAYLNQLPVQTMKIDRSFVLALTEDPDAFAIAAAIADLGRTLGLRTTAEGVETPEQLALLRRLGCTSGQGFLWSPARLVDDLVDLVAALPDRRFVVSTDVPAAAPAGRRRREEVTPQHGRDELVRMHGNGASLATIASALNAAGFRTPQGLRWHRASVARVISDLAYPQLRGGVGP